MRVNRLDLNQLLVLDAVLTHRSVSRAAAQVHLSQPAVSASLAKFRTYFGDPIVVPRGNALALTPFAESLIEPVRDLLMQAKALSMRRPHQDASRLERHVTLVASDYVQSILLVPMMARAALEAPGLSFEVRSISGYLHEELEQGNVDMVVSLASGVADRHPTEEVLRDGFSCVVWTGNDAVGATLTREQFLELGHAVVVLGRGRVPTLDQIAAERAGWKRRMEVKVPSFSMVPACVVGTNRIGTIQTQLARSMSHLWPIRVLPCPLPVDPVVTAMQWHRHQTEDAAIIWIRGALREIGARLAEASRGPPARGTDGDDRLAPRQRVARGRAYRDP